MDNAPEEQEALFTGSAWSWSRGISPQRRHPPTRYATPQPTIPTSESSPPRRPEYLWKLNRLGKPCASVSNESKRYTIFIFRDVAQASFSNGFRNGDVQLIGRIWAYLHDFHAFFKAHWHIHNSLDSSGRAISPTQRHLADNIQHSQETGIISPGGIPTRNPNKRQAADPHLRLRGHWDLRLSHYSFILYNLRKYLVQKKLQAARYITSLLSWMTAQIAVHWKYWDTQCKYL